MSTSSPTATGTLSSTPLVNLIVYALDHQLTGTLVLEQPDRQRHAIYFLSGAPTKVRLAESVAQLGALLVEQGHLNQEQRHGSYAAACANKQLHGQALQESGVISETVLRDALREQCVRKILHLATCPEETIFGYYDRHDFLENWGAAEAVRGRPLYIVWRLVQSHGSPARIADVLDRLGERPLRLQQDAPIRRFRFGRLEQAVIEVLRAKPQPFSELAARELADRSLLERLVYTLAITRQFDVGLPGIEPLGVDEAPSSSRIQIAPSFTPPHGFPLSIPGGTQSAVASPPRSSTPPKLERPEVTALKQEIRERASGSADQSFYDVLGVGKDATAAVIHSAYLVLAKKWHPDRLGPEYDDVRELASRVFARVSEAHEVLSDSAQRKEYNLKLRRAGVEANEQEHVQRVLRASTAFQKAEVLFKRNNLRAAEAEARQALADDPDQSDYLALLAWIQAQKPDANPEDSIKSLDRAIALSPNNVRAHFYRGQLYKRVGNDRRAKQDFRFVAERDPRNLDAIRELRLYQMRRSSPPGASSYPPANAPTPRPSVSPAGSEKSKSDSGGLISKFFKR